MSTEDILTRIQRIHHILLNNGGVETERVIACLADAAAALAATTNEAAAQAEGRTLSAADLERARQWYCSMVDVNPQYAEKADHELAARIYADLGMRVPHSLRDAALATQPVQAQGEVDSHAEVVRQLRGLKVLLGVDSPNVRGWAAAVQQGAQKTVNAAISALSSPATDEPLAWRYWFRTDPPGGNGMTVGPVTTDKREVAYGVGCFDQQPLYTHPAPAVDRGLSEAHGKWCPAGRLVHSGDVLKRCLDCRRAGRHECVNHVPAAGLSEAQEPKYTVNGHAIVNRASGEEIPADEPAFVFRARDVHAAYALKAYATQCGETAHALVVMDRIADFERFATQHPERMKTPDTALAASAPSQAEPRRGQVCEVQDCDPDSPTHRQWFPARFVALDLIAGEPIVQRDGAMPIYATWGSVRGIQKPAPSQAGSCQASGEPLGYLAQSSVDWLRQYGDGGRVGTTISRTCTEDRPVPIYAEAPPAGRTLTDDEMLDLAECLRPVLKTPADWGLALQYARAVLAASSTTAGERDHA